MSTVSGSELRVHPDLHSASADLADEIAQILCTCLQSDRWCTLALSGGDTPRLLHQMLATDHASLIDWNHLHLFWGDERYVPHDSPQSNFRMARETLIDHVPIPADNVHPMPTDFDDPEDAARACEAILRAFTPGDVPRLDIILLGIGADGHTASLFPGSTALSEAERAVVPSIAHADPPQRLTLTYPVINSAANVFFLVAGEDKAPVVAAALAGASPETLPAAGVRPTNGRLCWWLDESAASLVDKE